MKRSVPDNRFPVFQIRPYTRKKEIAMIVEEIMFKKPFTAKKTQSLLEAHELMVKHSIRHLPVVERNRLLGIITESDIRNAFIGSGPTDPKAPNPSKMKIQDHMTETLLTVTPDTNVEDAALVIYKNKIGALPVVQNQGLVGIISVMDIVGLFIDIMGILHASSRIDVAVGKDPKDLEKVSKIINDHELNIISVGLEPEAASKKTVYSFRLDLCETKSVVKDIEKAGFKVLEAID
jgi:acetoin utilization protein AcuB